MAKVKQTKRALLLSKDNNTVEQEAIVFQVQQDVLQLQADLLETQRQVSIKKQELLELKSEATLSPRSIIAKQDEIAGLEAGIKALEKLEKELF